jgi:hypothetical protein
LATPAVGDLLVICTTELFTCLNMLLSVKGLEDEEGVPCEEEVLEFICCVCAATDVGVSINPLYGIVIINAIANTTAVANQNRFVIGGLAEDYSSNLCLCMKVTCR